MCVWLFVVTRISPFVERTFAYHKVILYFVILLMDWWYYPIYFVYLEHTDTIHHTKQAKKHARQIGSYCLLLSRKIIIIDWLRFEHGSDRMCKRSHTHNSRQWQKFVIKRYQQLGLSLRIFKRDKVFLCVLSVSNGKCSREWQKNLFKENEIKMIAMYVVCAVAFCFYFVSFLQHLGFMCHF